MSYYTKVRKRVIWAVVGRGAHPHFHDAAATQSVPLSSHPRSPWHLSTFPNQHFGQFHPFPQRSSGRPTRPSHSPCHLPPSLLLCSGPAFLCFSHTGLVSIPPARQPSHLRVLLVPSLKFYPPIFYRANSCSFFRSQLHFQGGLP